MKLEQAARQALEALEVVTELYDDNAVGIEIEAITALREALAEQAKCKECGAKQAQIDRLMLEYCPDEMTPEQMQEWGNNQRPVEQAEQEPVAWWMTNGEFTSNEWEAKADGPDATPLYTQPVRTKDLTDEEIAKVWKSQGCFMGSPVAFARAVIAADREKNK